MGLEPNSSEKMATLCLLPLLVVLASVDCDRVPTTEVTVSGRRYLCHYQHKDRDSAQKKCSSEGMTLLEVEHLSLIGRLGSMDSGATAREYPRLLGHMAILNSPYQISRWRVVRWDAFRGSKASSAESKGSLSAWK